MSEKLSLRALIRAALDSSLSPDPADVVPVVLAQIPDGDVRGRLAEAIRSMLPSAASPAGRVSYPKPSVRSAKREAIRSWWSKYLQSRVMTASGWKMLADATADDLRFVAAHRRDQAKALLSQADQFEGLAARMDSAGVSRLADLDAASGIGVAA